MRKVAAAAAMLVGITFGLAGVADAGTGGTKMGQQCAKGTKGTHGACVRTLARGHGKTKHAVTTTTVATTPDTTVAPAP